MLNALVGLSSVTRDVRIAWHKNNVKRDWLLISPDQSRLYG